MILSKKFIDVLNPFFWKADERSQVPSNKIQFTFRLRYPTAKHVEWKQMDVFKWQVKFKIKEIVRWGLYTSDGAWLETLYPVPFEDIPRKIQISFKSKYDIDSLKQSHKIQTPLRTIFELQCTVDFYKLELLYDETGKMVGKMIV